MHKLISPFLNSNVEIETDKFTVKGRLLGFKIGERKNHIPNILIVQTDTGKIIVRAWSLIRRGSYDS